MNFKDYHGYKVWDNGVIMGKRLGTPMIHTVGKKTGYPCVTLMINGKKKLVKIHRLMGVLFLPNIYNKPEIDHIDRIRTNNSLFNLRWATRHEQVLNRTINRNNTSGVVGVCYIKKRDVWESGLINFGIRYHKTFKTKEEAIAQRLAWEQEYYL